MTIFQQIQDELSEKHIEEIKQEATWKLDQAIASLENDFFEKLDDMNRLFDEVAESFSVMALTSPNKELREKWEKIMEKKNGKAK